MKNIQNLIEENLQSERICKIYGICLKGLAIPHSTQVTQFGLKRLMDKKTALTQ